MCHARMTVYSPLVSGLRKNTWAMCFLGTTTVRASLILGKKLGAIFRV